MREDREEAARLENRLSDLVNLAYGFTPGEVELLWSTAPPGCLGVRGSEASRASRELARPGCVPYLRTTSTGQ